MQAIDLTGVPLSRILVTVKRSTQSLMLRNDADPAGGASPPANVVTATVLGARRTEP